MVLINNIYPKDRQRLFTNRKKELKLIEYNVESFLKTGLRKHLVLIGLRRIGKSLIIYEFIKRNKNKINISYIDLKKTSMEPQYFATDYIKKVLQWSLKTKEEDLLILANKLNNEKIFEQVNDFLNKKTKKNYLDQINFAFSFPELLSKLLNKKIVICIDEFQDILGMNRYKGIDDIIDIFRTHLQSQSNTFYIITGSVITTMEKICLDDKSALFLHFNKIINLYNFTKEDSFALIKKIFKQEQLSIHVKDILFTLFKKTTGNPFYLTILTQKIIELNKLFDLEIDENLINKAFLIELTNKNSRLYNYFNYIFENSLEKARGKASLKSVLFELAKEQPDSLSNLSEKLNKKSGEMRTLLKRLIEVDLVIQKQNKYLFRDNLLRKWVALFYLGINIEVTSSSKFINELLSQFQEKYQRVSTELGRATEYEYKVKLEKKLNIKLNNYNKNNLEFDLVGKKNNIYYIFEIKHRNKPANYKDVKNFLEKVEKSEFKKIKLFFISKSGFTKQAEGLIEKNGIGIL
ncbi:AAA family ATPase [Candidatus Woesearchaeota archaeon]|nr:AAA family ATPase [Candidatus Woesearchaeota archaeon]